MTEPTTIFATPTKAIRIKAVISPADMPRDRLVAEVHIAQPDVEMRFRSTDGFEYSGVIAGKKYRKAMRTAIEGEQAGQEMVLLLEGRLGPGGVLIDVGLTAQAAPRSARQRSRTPLRRHNAAEFRLQSYLLKEVALPGAAFSYNGKRQIYSFAMLIFAGKPRRRSISAEICAFAGRRPSATWTFRRNWSRNENAALMGGGSV
ncbi:hypothetical protein [Azospirillum argentinense]|uniref:Uncharacterized protein n=1 Tax=Azospirillum brasilense TaxID=192 RepID=A0A4D8QF23_AZOBR|nr:hypothetical protein [Azospirillum argentinense]QCO07443.1 hypothetical protein D3867_36785 [Azospirillum argentinense]